MNWKVNAMFDCHTTVHGKKKRSQFTQLEPRTELNQTGVNQFTPIQFGLQFGKNG